MNSDMSHTTLSIPPQLLSLLLPLLSGPDHVPQAFWTLADVHVHHLLSAYLGSYKLPGLSSVSSDAPGSSSSSYAFVDTLEFQTPKTFLAELYRQWGLAQAAKVANRGSWEHFLSALDQTAVAGAQPSEGDAPGKTPSGRVLVIDHAEGLKFTPGGLGGLLLGLSEMTTHANVTVIFLSSMPWDYLRPIPSLFPDPVYLSIPAFSDAESAVFLADNPPVSPSHPFALHVAPYHNHLLSLAFSTHPDPLTLLRISHALWPIFISPLIPGLPPLEDIEDGLFAPISGSKNSVLDLIARSKAAFRIALEDPSRLPSSVEAFALRAKALRPLGQNELNGHAQQQAFFRPLPTSLPSLSLLPPLPRYARYLLLASYLASFAPPNKDLRLFSRARHEGSKVRGGGVRKQPKFNKLGKGLSTKVPQSLVGPKAVGVDRVLAIWGALVVEHERPSIAVPVGAAGGRNFTWEDEVSSLMGSAAVRSLITTLTNQHLIQRTSLPSTVTGEEKIDAVMLKAGVGWEEANALGRQLGITISDYWGGDE